MNGKTIQKRYCSYCGKEITPVLVGAENYSEIHEFCITIPYKKYNYKTGKRNYLKRFKCPNSTFFNNRHDDYAEK
ncbi:MAG: hypothetical protein WC472_01530 [Candidatus Paceibacterota bacterium]